MAQKRMFSLQIVDTDAFLEMPATSQLLYFHLGMRADDDGFVSNPKKIMKITNSQDDDLKILLGKRFLIGFDSGVVVIKHWKINNYIQNDRYKETGYRDEKSSLLIKENGAYTECIQEISMLDTQIRLDKIRLDKIRIDKNKEEKEEHPKQLKNIIPPTLDMVVDYCKERGNKVNAQKFIDHYTANGWKVGKNKMIDWQASIRNNWEKDNYNNKKEFDIKSTLADWDRISEDVS